MQIYSDRCADLSQLLRFLDGEVRRAPADPRFVDYALAPAFGSRVGLPYESRAEGIAVDLAEGYTPERLRAFHERVLALRARPGLAEAMHARFVPVFAPLLPSLAPKLASADGALHFVVGPEAQLASYEREVRAALPVGIGRLHPRDFWDDVD
jgi:hypothetical protein